MSEEHEKNYEPPKAMDSTLVPHHRIIRARERESAKRRGDPACKVLMDKLSRSSVTQVGTVVSVADVPPVARVLIPLLQAPPYRAICHMHSPAHFYVERIRQESGVEVAQRYNPRRQSVIECFRGQQRGGGGATLLTFACSSPDLLIMQQNEPFLP